MRPIALATCLILLPATLFAATIHVPTHQPTIQAGIDAASAGDTVLVACGVYYEHDIEIKSGICLSSETGEAGCVTIDAQGQGRVLYSFWAGTDTHIIGLTIRGGTSEEGGGGYWCDNSSPLLMRCTFVDNAAAWAGAIDASLSSPSLDKCTFVNNYGNSNGGAIRFLGSTSIPSSASLNQCTFIGNSATHGGGIYCDDASPLLESCIIAFSINGLGLFCWDADSNPTLICCDIYGNAGGDWTGCIEDQASMNGNISEDPLFCDPEMGDYSLRSDSPCAPGNNDCGVLMGAWSVGCSTSAESATWSDVKSLF